MTSFSIEEIEAIDRLWRSLPIDHMWTGWAASGEMPDEVWIFRTRAHWRRFPLRKTETGYVLSNEKNTRVVEAETLADLLLAVEQMPGLGVVAHD